MSMNMPKSFWYARELQAVLEYTQWRRFEGVIDKAIEACQNSNIDVAEHFASVGKTIPLLKYLRLLIL